MEGKVEGTRRKSWNGDVQELMGMNQVECNKDRCLLLNLEMSLEGWRPEVTGKGKTKMKTYCHRGLESWPCLHPRWGVCWSCRDSLGSPARRRTRWPCRDRRCLGWSQYGTCCSSCLLSSRGRPFRVRWSALSQHRLMKQKTIGEFSKFSLFVNDHYTLASFIHMVTSPEEREVDRWIAEMFKCSVSRILIIIHL